MNTVLSERMKREKYKLVSIDLFSGPGGLCTGFKWAGILPLIAVEWTDTTVETYSKTHNTDVFALSEYQKDKQYIESFLHESDKTLLIHGDINKVTNQMINKFLLYRYGIDSKTETIDVVSGGAPCESFSMAGTRTDGDKRDDLFSNIIRIAKAVKSKAILFENVKGMFSKARGGVKGNAFEYICDRFESDKNRPSYSLVSRNPSTVLLKACDYGVPQMRERLFLVSIRRNLSKVKFEYPEKEYGPNRKYPYVTVKDALSDLPQVNMGEESIKYKETASFENENQRRFISIMRGRYIDEDMNSAVPEHLKNKQIFADNLISSHRGPGHIKRKQDLLSLIPVGSSMKAVYEQLVQNGEFEKYKHLFPRTIYGSRNRRLLLDQPSFTVTSHCLDEILHPYLNRAVTPREAARLQSFPDWYQFAGPYVQFHGDKEQDKYEQIGDAIPPLLAYALAKQFVKCLDNHKED